MGEFEYRVVYRAKTENEPRFWSVWPSDKQTFDTLPAARAAQVTLEGLRGDCDTKIQIKPLPKPWEDLEDK